MIEAFFRVELTKTLAKNNPYFGKINAKKVLEERFTSEYDKCDDIAPSGIIATIQISDGELNIKCNKYALSYDETGDKYDWYKYLFDVDGKVYELWVAFDHNTKEIYNLLLNEWYEHGYFEDNDDADEIHHINDFKFYEKYN